jgi:hypothetical protein
MSVLGQKRDPEKAAKRREGNGYEFPDEKVQQREKVYLIYQDMGVTRSFNKLDGIGRAAPAPRCTRARDRHLQSQRRQLR